MKHRPIMLACAVAANTLRQRTAKGLESTAKSNPQKPPQKDEEAGGGAHSERQYRRPWLVRLAVDDFHFFLRCHKKVPLPTRPNPRSRRCVLSELVRHMGIRETTYMPNVLRNMTGRPGIRPTYYASSATRTYFQSSLPKALSNLITPQ